MGANFDRIMERRGTDSLKWDGCREIFGTDELLPMWVADSDWRAPQVAIDAIIERAKHGIFGYTLPGNELDRAVVNWVKRRYGWEIEQEWLVYTSGVVPAINVAIKGFTRPGDGVIIQSPVYYPFFSAIERNGTCLVNNQLIYNGKRYLMDFKDLEEKLSTNQLNKKDESRIKLIILCSPHNPVGRVWEKEELIHLGKICGKYGVLVVSDEIHADLIFRGYRHIPFGSLSNEFAKNSITMIAPSKTFNLAGLHCSVNIIPDPDIRARFKEAMDGFVTRGNVLGFAAMKAVYSKGDEWLEEQLDYLQANLEYALDFIEKQLPGVTAVKPEGTYLLWMDFSGLGMEDQELNDFMIKKARVGLDAGSWFGPGGEGYMRLNLACPRRTLKQGLSRIREAVLKESKR